MALALFVPSRIAQLLCPFQTSWRGVFIPPFPLASPLLGEPGRSHRLRKGGLGGDSQRGVPAGASSRWSRVNYIHLEGCLKGW